MSARWCIDKSSLPSVLFTCFQSYAEEILLDINRLVNPSTASANTDAPPVVPLEPRILILSVSPDVSTSYIPLMNSIFSAQKLVSILPKRCR